MAGAKVGSRFQRRSKRLHIRVRHQPNRFDVVHAHAGCVETIHDVADQRLLTDDRNDVVGGQRWNDAHGDCLEAAGLRGIDQLQRIGIENRQMRQRQADGLMAMGVHGKRFAQSNMFGQRGVARGERPGEGAMHLFNIGLDSDKQAERLGCLMHAHTAAGQDPRALGRRGLDEGRLDRRVDHIGRPVILV